MKANGYMPVLVEEHKSVVAQSIVKMVPPQPVFGAKYLTHTGQVINTTIAITRIGARLT